MGDDDIKIIDEENSFGGKDEEFSHSQLVMLAMKKCVVAGNKEMCNGWENTRTDARGNTITTYVEDTRKRFIESVKSLKMIMSCDFDKTIDTNLKKLEEDVEESFKKYLNQEKMDWGLCHQGLLEVRGRNGIFFQNGCLNPNLQYFQTFIDEKVEIYREIFSELNKLAARKDFYRSEVVTV